MAASDIVREQAKWRRGVEDGSIGGGGGGGSPAGADTEIQYNDSGAFGASANFTYDGNLLNIRRDGLGLAAFQIITDLGATLNRSLTIRTPAADNTQSPFTFATGNGFSFAPDLVEAFLIDDQGDVYCRNNFALTDGDISMSNTGTLNTLLMNTDTAPGIQALIFSTAGDGKGFVYNNDQIDSVLMAHYTANSIDLSAFVQITESGNIQFAVGGVNGSGAVNRYAFTPTEATLRNFVFDVDQSVGAGQDGYVLTYDDGTGLISLEAAGGGGSNPAEVANFRRAGPIQLFDGGTGLANFNVTASITASTWESVGPTGSGADNIWPALDSLPAEATAILVGIAGSVVANATGSLRMQVYSAAGDEATPDNTNGNQILNFQGECQSTESITSNAQVWIPLDSGGSVQDFQLYWFVSAQSGSVLTQGCQLRLAGFATDT